MGFSYSTRRGVGKYAVAPQEQRTADGIVFHSKREMEEWHKLKMLEKAGIIHDLKRQVRFPLWCVNPRTGKQEVVCTYVADFTCLDMDEVLRIYESKGVKTQMYKLKAKMFMVCYPHLRIVEV